MSIADNLQLIKKNIPKKVSLVAVSKTKPTTAIIEAYAAGQRVFGENKIEFKNNLAICQGKQISLTEQELRLLRLFIANRGRALSRGEILELAWGFSKSLSTRTVDNFVVRFRKYFEEDPKNPIYFKSRRSVGYVFDH